MWRDGFGLAWARSAYRTLAACLSRLVKYAKGGKGALFVMNDLLRTLVWACSWLTVLYLRSCIVLALGGESDYGLYIRQSFTLLQ